MRTDILHKYALLASVFDLTLAIANEELAPRPTSNETMADVVRRCAAFGITEHDDIVWACEAMGALLASMDRHVNGDEAEARVALADIPAMSDAVN